ncbi:MAG: hypothetical protein OEY03_17695 [Rhizobacter sp.]|nr:hypothetical protein [Rhizobacter sp.]
MDEIFETWLRRQHDEARALSDTSDVLSLAAETGAAAPRRFIARFASPTMVLDGSAVRRADGFAVLFQFPRDHLRSACDPGQLVHLLGPANTFHPNVAPPFICIGRVAPATGLCELIYQVHEILTFQKLTPREDDALNRDACAWARRHMNLFPLSTAPLRRRTADFSIDEMPVPASPEPRHA